MERSESLKAFPSCTPGCKSRFILFLSAGVTNPYSLLSYVRGPSCLQHRKSERWLTATFADHFSKQHCGQTVSGLNFHFCSGSKSSEEGRMRHSILLYYLNYLFLCIWIWIQLFQHFCLPGVHFRLRGREVVP